MAIRYYCDYCDAEVTDNPVSKRVSGSGFDRSGNKPGVVEIIFGTGKTWNQGHVCPPCFRERVIDAIDTRFGKP